MPLAPGISELSADLRLLVAARARRPEQVFSAPLPARRRALFATERRDLTQPRRRERVLAERIEARCDDRISAARDGASERIEERRVPFRRRIREAVARVASAARRARGMTELFCAGVWELG